LFLIIFYSSFYQVYRKTARGKNYLISSPIVIIFFSYVRIFSEFFINFLILHFLIPEIIFINMRKCGTKNSEKILRGEFFSLGEENIQLRFFCKVDST